MLMTLTSWNKFIPTTNIQTSLGKNYSRSYGFDSTNVLRALLAPVAFLLRIVGEILARALSCALSVVVGVFALGAMVALLALFLTHT